MKFLLAKSATKITGGREEKPELQNHWLLPAGSKLTSELYLLAPPFLVKSACPRAAPSFCRIRRQNYVVFCSFFLFLFFCFWNHSHLCICTYFEHLLQQQFEGYPAKRAEKVL